MTIKGTKEKIKVAFIDVTSKVENEARDLSESKMTADKEELKGFIGRLRRIWKHNLARGWYIRKEYDKARENIINSKNLYANESSDREDHEKVMKSITDRFISEYQEVIHNEAGEQKEKLGDSEVEKEIKSKIERIVKEYAFQDLSQKDVKENFENEKNAILSRIKGVKREVIKKGSLFADNLFEVVRQVQQSLEQGKKLYELDLDFEIIVGRAKDRVRTEAQYNAVDKIVDKITHSKVGCFVNEATLASALSVVYCGGGKIMETIARSRLLAWATFGAAAILGSGIAAFRESQMFEEDRKRHLRDIAQGKKFDFENKPERAKMESFKYETVKANDLADNLEKELYTYNGKGERRMRDLSKEDIQNVFNYLAEIESRVSLSDRMKIDLISYSSVKKAEQEGLRLDLLRWQVKADLKKYFADKPELTNELFSGQNWEYFLRDLNEVKIESLIKGESGIEAVNRMAKKKKLEKVTRKAVKTLVLGLVFGAAFQEIKSFFDGNEESLFSQLFGVKKVYAAGITGAGIEPQRYTALGYFYRWMTGNFPRMDTQYMHDVAFEEQHFQLPRGASLLKNPDGTLRLMRGNEIFIDRIPVDAKGQLTPEGQSILSEYDVKIKGTGIGRADHSHYLVPKDYIEKNKGLFRHIKRCLWYDNDTPAPVFDKNELKLWWGGKAGTGIDANGNYVFNVKHMTPDGSYHKNFSVNAQEAIKSGKLKMLLSLSRDTQCDVVEVPIDTNGNAVIDPNSEVGKRFFKTINGKHGARALFTGKFAEVAQIMGEKNGVDQVRILATHVGEGMTKVKWTPPIVFDMPTPIEVEPPPFIPIVDRWPLEKAKPPQKPYITGYFQNTIKNQEFYKKRQSKSLENSSAKLDHRKEIEDYFNRQSETRLKKTRQLAEQIKEPMNSNCEIAVCIPVAGHQEGRNIYNTLNWYKDQKNYDGNDFDKNKYEIILFVNHPSDQKPDETLSEIARFQKDNPGMPVRVVYSPFERKEVQIGNFRKYAADIALLRSQQRGAQAKDLIIISNDADCKGMSKSYLASILDGFSKRPGVDGVLGKLDWEPEAFLKSPLLYLGTRLFQYIDIANRYGPKKAVGSSGANFAYRSSIYAAVGGYIESDTIAEDRHLGEMIKNARLNSGLYPLEFGGVRSMLYTNARRAVEAVKFGRAPAEQWSEFGPDDELRKLEWEIGDNEDISKLLEDSDYQKKLKQGLERFINRTLKVYGVAPQSPEAKKALRMMGVKYQVKNDQVVITDISLIINWLKEYQKKGLEIKERNIRK